MTPKTSVKLQTSLDQSLAMLADFHSTQFQRYVNEWLCRHRGPVRKIAFSMGQTLIYGRNKRLLDAHEVPKRLRPLLDYAKAIETHFGAIHIEITTERL